MTLKGLCPILMGKADCGFTVAQHEGYKMSHLGGIQKSLTTASSSSISEEGIHPSEEFPAKLSHEASTSSDVNALVETLAQSDSGAHT
eukprot:g46359.t1